MKEKGSDENLLREMSMMRGEPDWVLDLRLTSFKYYKKVLMPHWVGDISAISFEPISQYIKSSERPVDNQHDLALAINDADESEVVFDHNSEDLERLGVIFCDMETALRDYPELVKPYLGKIISTNDNKFAALNTSVWSGGSFIYVPPGVEVAQPLQAYPRAGAAPRGQFERTLIIADEGSKVQYIEGCSAPVYTPDSLRSAAVEIIVRPSAHVGYTTIQNWSANVFNLVTKRAHVEAEGHMRWIDGNIGSRFTKQYPAVLLAGPKASGEVLSVAYAGEGQHQHSGAELVHAAPETTSTVVAKSVCSDGGRATFRSRIRVGDDAFGCRSDVQHDALILDDDSDCDAYPDVEIGASDARVGQEATVSELHGGQLFYLMSRGLSEEQAIGAMVNGFTEPITRTLPMEYAVEWSRLIELQIGASIG